jgi:S-adenosylmethionine synthetase
MHKQTVCPLYSPKYMALTKKDLLEFGQELTKSLTHMWRTDLRIALEQQSQDIKRDIRDEMDARFVAFRSEFSTFKQEIRVEIAETITDNVLPAMDRMHQDLKQEIREVRRYVGMTS